MSAGVTFVAVGSDTARADANVSARTTADGDCFLEIARSESVHVWPSPVPPSVAPMTMMTMIVVAGAESMTAHNGRHSVTSEDGRPPGMLTGHLRRQARQVTGCIASRPAAEAATQHTPVLLAPTPHQHTMTL